MNSTVKTVVFWLMIALSGVAAVVRGASRAAAARKTKKSTSRSSWPMSIRDNVHDVTIVGQEVHGKYKQRHRLPYHHPPTYPEMYQDAER